MIVPKPMYTADIKLLMVRTYSELKNLTRVANMFGCSSSTVYYAVYPDAYERHKEHVRLMASNKLLRR